SRIGWELTLVRMSSASNRPPAAGSFVFTLIRAESPWALPACERTGGGTITRHAVSAVNAIARVQLRSSMLSAGQAASFEAAYPDGRTPCAARSRGSTEGPV